MICFYQVSDEYGDFCPTARWMFEADRRLYSCLYEYLASCKAELFGDRETLRAIRNCTDPFLYHHYAQAVRGCNDILWNGQRSIILARGLAEQVDQNPDLAALLVRTGEEVLAYCDAAEKELGTGTWISEPEESLDMRRWTGLNLLGFAWMDLRKRQTEFRRFRRRRQHAAADASGAEDAAADAGSAGAAGCGGV